MASQREDLRQEIRDNIQEASGVTNAIWSDALLNRHITREILSLPKKEIYLEQTWSASLDPATDYTNGLVLPEQTVKVESVERNEGSADSPYWTDYKGCDFYSGALFFPSTIMSALDIRVKIKAAFTPPDSDGVDIDVPDDLCEVVVWGVTIRCYKILIGYLRGSVSWDAVTKPSDVGISTIQNWLKDAKKEYEELVQMYATSPRPRFVDLVS